MMKSIFFTALLMMANSGHTLTISSINLSEEISPTATSPALKLNGAALRELYLLVETYVGALYLESPSQDPQFIISSEQHKRMEFHVIMKKVSARRLSNALREALILNISEKELAGLQPDIDAMLSFFEGNLRSGDTVIFDYNPKVGTQVIIGNKPKGVISGNAFYSALLKVWVGENPVTREFKEQILGLATSA